MGWPRLSERSRTSVEHAATSLHAGWHRPKSARDWARLAAWGLLAFGLAAPIIRLTVGYDSIGLAFTLPVALGALLWVTPRRYELRTWLFYVVALYFFTQLRDAADETSIKASTGYVLDWELWMFGGDTPSAWLQARAGGAQGDPGALAFFSAFVHWSWFIFPHAVVVATFFFARAMFFRVAVIMAGTYFFAVALYYLVPTVPPWMAVEQGALTGIRRIMEDVGPQLVGQSVWDSVFGVFADPNPRAAIPSLHFAASFTALIVAVFLRAPRLFAFALLYCIVLTFALMYLGEHYFADILAGGAAALASVFIVETALGNGPGVGIARWVRTRVAATGRAPQPSGAAGAPGRGGFPTARHRCRGTRARR